MPDQKAAPEIKELPVSPCISLECPETLEVRILEGTGCEIQKLSLTVYPASAALEAACSNPSMLQTSLDNDILTLIPLQTGTASVSITASSPGYRPAIRSISVEINKYIESGQYEYKHIPIPGGGFVTGFVFHPAVPGILYARTDIGGAYRYNFQEDSWISLIDHATDPGMWETFPLSLALDRQNPSYIYAMVGDNYTNKIAFSDDYGTHWRYFSVPSRDTEGNPVRIHGNAPGRATGERLVVDPNDWNTLYMATMEDGLWKTHDQCRSWTKLSVAFPGKDPETGFAFVEIDPASGGNGSRSNTIVAATYGQQGSPDGSVRGPSVYISNDGGTSFKVLEGAPPPVIGGPADHPGYVGQRAAFMGRYLYITYSAYNIGWSKWNSCGCDTGASYDGALYRFQLDENGEVIEALDITPPNILEPGYKDTDAPNRRLGFGMGGVSADPQKPGTLVCSTITAKTDTIYRSNDWGLTWKPVMSGLAVGKIDFNVPYLKTKYSGNNSCVHWMSDVKINPFDSDVAVFNTGLGIFMTKNLTKAVEGQDVVWAVSNSGVEETVHLNIYSPPSGNVKLIDILGDYGGFVFTDLDKPAENTFANRNHDRWVTAMNADYPDSNPNLIIATPRGNWTGHTKGGLILSLDQGKTWEQLKDPLGLTKELDAIINYLKRPNTTSGWAAISADGHTILWAVGESIQAANLVRSCNFGYTWELSRVYDMDGNIATSGNAPIKVMSHRVNPDIFYGFGSESGGARFYVSTDKGAIFHQIKAPEGFPPVTLSGIDSSMPYEIRVESGKHGVIWMGMQEHGLWRVTYNKDDNRFIGERVSAAGDNIKRIGLGKPMQGSEIKTLYCSGTVGGVYGFWRSQDGGSTWKRINDDKHQYGDIRTITGDPRVFGRIYVGTGTRGLVYGDPLWVKVKE